MEMRALIDFIPGAVTTTSSEDILINPALDGPQNSQNLVIFIWSGEYTILWVVRQSILYHQLNGLYSSPQVRTVVLHNGVFCPCCDHTK